jgi:tetratricopeptide (TPR) repeat protein
VEEKMKKLNLITIILCAISFSNLNAQKPDPCLLKLSTAYEYYKNKDFNQAKPYYWEIIKNCQGDKFARAYKDLADIFLQLKMADSTEYVARIGLEKFPKDIQLHYFLAYLLSSKNDIPGAIKEYEVLVQLLPNNKDYWKTLGELYFSNGQTDQAIVAYDSLLKLDPNNLEAHDKQTQMVRSKGAGFKEEYIKKLEEGLTKDPNNTAKMMELGEAHTESKEFDKTVKILTKLVEKDPNNVKALDLLGNAYLNLSKFNDAIKVNEKILKIEPKNTLAMCDIADSYKSLKNYTKAREYCEKSIKTDPNFGLAYMTLGGIYETTAEECINAKGGFGKIKYEDKLVYVIAYGQYKKAEVDLREKSKAESRQEQLKSLLPTKEDVFFNEKKVKRPMDKCYKWIGDKHPDTNYIDSYIKAVKK